MRKVLTLSALVIAIAFAGAGCKYLENKRYEKIGPPRTSPPMVKDGFTTNEIEAMADAVVQIKKQRAAILPPTPSGPPIKKSRIKAASLPWVPDKWVVIRWDASPEPFVTYRLQWYPIRGTTGDHDEAEVDQTKVDVIGLFKYRGVGRGWYRLQVEAVNEVFLTSDPVTACDFFYWPQ